MNSKKISLLNLAVAMIFSLAMTQGISTKNNQDVNLQQVAWGAAYMGGESEGGEKAGYYAISAMAGGIAVNVATGGAFLWWNPVGWGAFGVAAGAGL